MENHITVSVIIPVYNTEPYLEECLESACNQTLKSLEIICVDDGSTDKSLSILKKFADMDSRIRIIGQANRGASHARNMGIQQAQGKYIYFLDSDDYLAPEALETLVNTMEARELEILLFNANVFGEGGVEENRLQNEKSYFRRVHEYPTVCKGEDLFRRLMENQEYTAPAPVLLTKSTFLKDNSLLFYEDIIHEDELFVFECLLLAFKAGYVNETLYFRRVRQDSVMDLRQSEKVTFSVFSIFACVKQMLQFCHSAELKEENEEAVFSNLERMVDDCQNRYERLDETARTKLLEMVGKDKFLFKSLIEAPYEDRASILRLQAAVKQRDETLRLLEAESREKEALQKELMAIKTSRGFRFLSKYYQARILIRNGLDMLLHGNRKTEKSESISSATDIATDLEADVESDPRNLLNRYYQMTGETIDLHNLAGAENSVLIVEFNDYHGECIPGLYRYLADMHYDVDFLIHEGAYTEKALDMIHCNRVYHCDVELMALLLQHLLIERYKFVIFNSNAFTWKGKWHTVLQEFPFLKQYLDKIYVLEHQMEYLDRTLLEMGHVFVLTDKLPVDKRLIPVNCHWFGNTGLPSKNKVTRFISVGAIEPARKNFKKLLDAVRTLNDHGITNFRITVIGLGSLVNIDPQIRHFFSVWGRVTYSTLYDEMRRSDFLLTLLDPESPDHDRYITRGTSGSFQLIYGFSKPCLIAEKFADVYGFSSENAVVYMGNNDLGAAMQKAIAMTDVEYDRMRNNLISMSRAIYNQSFANLKRALGNSINTGDNICPLKKETPERKIALENGIPSSKRITTYDDRVTLINYWTADPSVCNRDWLYRFVKNNTDIKHLNIFSIFGKKEYIEKYATKNDVFYSGENLDVKHGMYDEYCDYCLDYVGLSLGFAQRSEANYLRLPLWMLWIFDPVIDKDRIAERVDYINRSRNTGKYECSVIARHDNWNMRTPIYEALKDKINILCAGQWNNNTNILWDEYKDDKIKLLNNCKFTICAENEDTPDYVTEKLFEAFLGGCIPIYAGGASNPEPGVVNPEAVLLWERGNKENNDAIVKKVCELNANEALYAEFLSRTKLLPYTVDYVYDTFLQLKKRLEALERQEQLIHAVTRHITDTVLLRDKPGLLIDVTHVTAIGNWRTGLLRPDGKIWMTGISRVVNNLFHQIYNQSENVVPVQHQSGKFITGYSYLSHMEGIEEKIDQTVSLQRGDKIFLLDDPWTEFDAFSRILDMAAERGVKSYGIVHDLIPVQYPEVCDNETVQPKFIGWHHMLLQKADAVVCVSRTTADALIGYYEKMRFVRSRPLAVYFFHEGADIPEGVQSVREEIRRFVEGGRFTFLMVGTVEPRKGHRVVLQALQKLPENIRKNCRLLIIGKDGWKNEDVHKMLALPELKETVLWVRDGSDEELRWAYAHTGALIAASLQEGFGLPLVEAAHFGLPLICSDIPVFREVTRGNADFFQVMDAEALEECLMKWMQTDRHPDSRKIPIYSWQESAREVLDILEGKIEPYKVLQ